MKNIIVVFILLSGLVSSTWWDSDYAGCKGLNLTESDGVNRWNYPILINATDIIFYSTDELRVVNQSCDGESGNAMDYKIVSSGSDWIEFTILSNVTGSTTEEFSIYYNYSEALSYESTLDLVLWLPNENECGIDKSGQGNDAEEINETVHNPSGGFAGGGGCHFNGSAYMFSTSTNAFPSNDDKTLFAWITIDNLTSGARYFGGIVNEPVSDGHIFSLVFGSDDDVASPAWGGDDWDTNIDVVTALYAYPQSNFQTWSLVYTLSTTDLRFYMNGTEKADTTSERNSVYDQWYVGKALVPSQTSYWNGSIDEYMVWTKALDTNEMIGLSTGSIVVTSVGVLEISTTTTTTSTSTTTTSTLPELVVNVYDYVTMLGVEDAQVRIFINATLEGEGFTDSLGQTVISIVNGTKTITVSHIDYLLVTNETNLSVGDTISFIIQPIVGYSVMTITLDDLGLNYALCIDGITDCYPAGTPIILTEKKDYQITLLPTEMNMSLSTVGNIFTNIIEPLLIFVILLITVAGIVYVVKKKVLK